MVKTRNSGFFAEEWANCLQQGPKYPIGEYLKQAALLKQEDIEYILDLQQKIPVKFWKIAVHQELIKETTLNFCLDNLFCQASVDTIFLS